MLGDILIVVLIYIKNTKYLFICLFSMCIFFSKMSRYLPHFYWVVCFLIAEFGELLKILDFHWHLPVYWFHSQLCHVYKGTPLLLLLFFTSSTFFLSLSLTPSLTPPFFLPSFSFLSPFLPPSLFPFLPSSLWWHFPSDLELIRIFWSH